MGKDAEVVEKVEVKKKKKKLIPVAILVIGLLGGGALAGGFIGGGKAEAEGGHGKDKKAEHVEPEPGVSITLDPQTISLADGNYLKVAISLQLPHEVPEEAPFAELAAHGEPMKPEAFKAAYAAPALDETVTVMSHFTYDQLATPEGKQAAKAELAEKVKKRYHGGVMDVYFTELVLQRA